MTDLDDLEYGYDEVESDDEDEVDDDADNDEADADADADDGDEDERVLDDVVEPTLNNINALGQIRVIVIKPENRILSDAITIFEYAAVKGIRAQQIENGDEYYVKLEGETNAIDIAEKEIRQGRCPLTIERVVKKISGEMLVEHWPVNELSNYNINRSVAV
jgi:DNA-directed RNA polymerase subunit K/omega